MAATHLDVGVGTGWYLDRCRFPVPKPRVALLDLNSSSLAAAARRIERYRPDIHRADVLRPLPAIGSFESIALTYLLHCLPGTIAEKPVAFDNLVPHLATGGVMFGATLLSEGVARGGVARGLMRTYNRKGIFSNEQDSLAGLRSELERRFRKVELEVVGCAALFAVREPR